MNASFDAAETAEPSLTADRSMIQRTDLRCCDHRGDTEVALELE